ncbi:MFS transporter [Microlunatus soli]|uniref:Predicted arabinose efflux permease, MFS family n=1 Tax=Microlunatus soli TaxID=630515 RepID=A0A1H1WHE7_9ACTN|nr:MFS transporter [Microlunatus soli]SDS96472.1 Predicted arabinose efflux permease, MFS family [Microlunatus soli]
MTAILPFTSHGHGRWPRPLLVLVVARAVNQLGAFAMSFLAVTLVDSYGASLHTAGLVVALFGLATIPSRLIGGALADRIGRRGTIIIGLVGCAVGLLIIAASRGVGGAAVGSLILGLFFEIYEPPSQALLADLVPADRRPEAFGLLGAALAAAGVAAGALAALLGGIGLRWLFVADAISCLVSAAMVSAWVCPPRSVPLRTERPRQRPWRDRRLLIMLLVCTGFALAWMIGVTALPLTVAARGFAPSRTGWLLAAAALVTIGGRRLLRFGVGRPFTLMAVGLLVVAGGFVVCAAAGTFGLLLLGAAIVALGQVFLLGPPYSVAAGLADDTSRAGYLAVFGTGWGIAQTVGPLIATRLLAAGTASVWLVGAAICCLLSALLPVVARMVGVQRVPGRVLSLDGEQ